MEAAQLGAARLETAQQRRQILTTSAVASGVLLGVGVVESLARGQEPFTVTAAVVSAVAFGAVLTLRLVRPQSTRLTLALAAAATLTFLLLPALLMTPTVLASDAGSPTVGLVDTLSVSALLSLTYSLRGWAALLVAGAVVVVVTSRAQKGALTS